MSCKLNSLAQILPVLEKVHQTKKPLFLIANDYDQEAIQALIAKLGFGMSTALTTTLVGLIASVLLKLQFFLLETQIEDEKNSFLP